MAVLGAMIFAFLEAMDVATVRKVNSLLVWHRDNVDPTGNPVFDKCVKAEMDRFIAATDAVIS